MEIKTVKTCPLGSKCQEIKDGVIKECMWFVKLVGTNPQTGEEIDEHGCSMAWLPVLLVEGAKQQRNTSASVESMRNEMVSAAKETTRALMSVQTTAPMLNGVIYPAIENKDE